MNYSVFRFTLNMHSHRSQASVSAFQGDTAIKLCITITDGGNIYKIEDGCVAILSGTKADGSKLWDRCVIERDTIIYDFNEKTTSCAGAANCEITLYGGDGRIITAPKFVIVVDEREVPGDANVPSDGDSNTAIDVVLDAAAQVPQIEERVRAIVAQSEAWANESESHASDAKQHAELAMEEQTKASEYAVEINQRIGSLDFSYNKDTGVLTFSYESDGETVTRSIDLPIESSIVELTEIKKEDMFYLHYKLASGYEGDIELDDIFKGNEDLLKSVETHSEDILKLQEDVQSNTENVQKQSQTIANMLNDVVAHSEAISTLEQKTNELESELNVSNKKIEDLEVAEQKTNKRLANLESATLDFIEDSSIAYSKSVPENALPYAEVTKIGGMTRKCNNLLNPNSAEIVKNARIAISSGETYKRDGYNVSHYILVNSGREYSLDLRETSYYAWYGADKVFISGSDASLTNYLLQAPINAVYLRFDYPQGIDVMLNEGDTALPYEPFFEGLRSAPVSELVSEGVNLIDDLTGVMNYRLGSDGLPYAEDGYVLFDFIAVEPNTVYRRSRSINIVEPVCFYDDEKDFIERLTTESALFTTTANTKYIRTNVSTRYRENLMLNKGSTALPYRPYFKRTLPIPEAVRPAHGINENAYDYIEWCEDGTRKLYKCITKTVFNGSEAFQEVFSNTLGKNAYGHHLTIRALTTAENICGIGKSNIYPFNFNGGDITNTFRFTTLDGRWVYFYPNDINTLDEWKAYLAELYTNGNPLTIIYAHPTPEVTDISDILTDDNFVEVQGGGSMTPVNEFGYAVPTTINYITDIGE